MIIVPTIDDIELIIRDLIRINEKIVTTYDSKLLCRDYENTVSALKKLDNEKLDLIKQLESSMNEFFKIKQNFITEKLNLASFKLIPRLTTFQYKFNIPQSVDTSSHQYFCYTYLMDKLTKEYDVITNQKDGYYILDITAPLKLKDLFKENNL